MEITYNLPEDKEDFPWDKNQLDSFKDLIAERRLKCRMDDIFLLGILRAKKFEQERAYKLLSNYYSSRKNYSELFSNLNSTSLEKCLALNATQLLPHLDQHGRYMITAHFSRWDTDVATVTDIARCIILYIDLYLNTHRLQVNGLVLIINVAGITWRHVVQMTPRIIRIFIATLVNSYQVRYKEVHYINVNAVFKTILTTLLIPFLPEKLKKRIHIHSGDLCSLHKYIPPAYLPEEFGGELSDINNPGDVYRILKNNEDFFRKNEAYWT